MVDMRLCAIAVRAWLFTAGLSGLAAAEGAPPELRALAERHRAAATLTGTFTWRVRPILGEESDPRPARNGSFAIRAPGSYSITIREPGADGSVDRWLSDGRNRWEISLLTPDDQPDIRGPFPCDAGDADYRRVVACLRLDLEALAEDHVLASAPVDKGTILTLRPRNPDQATKGPQVVALTITLDQAGTPTAIDIDHSDGSRWAVAVTGIQRDVPVAERMFQP